MKKPTAPRLNDTAALVRQGGKHLESVHVRPIENGHIISESGPGGYTERYSKEKPSITTTLYAEDPEQNCLSAAIQHINKK